MIRLPAIPIIHRELLTAARSPRSGHVRLAVGAFAVLSSVIAIALMDTFSVGGGAGGGKSMLGLVSTTAYLYCIAVGFSLTLTSISEERDQGTLSLLFLTDLRGGEIVLAKLFTRSLRTLEGLIAAMPLVATCILLGGVTPGEYGRVALALINALFVSAALGMYISSQRLQRTAAAFLGGALALSIGVLVPFLGQVLTDGFKLPALGLAVSSFSPWTAIPFSTAAPLGGISPQYWQTLCSSFLTGLLFLAMAIRSVRANWQDRPNEVKKLRRRKDFQNWDFKSSSRDPDYRRRLLDLNPICWLNSRDRFRSIGYWIYLGVIYFTMALCWWFLDKRDSPLGYWSLAALLFDIGIRAKINQAAGIQLVEERKQGTLEMLLCAPLGLPKILKGFFLALRRQFSSLLLCAAGINFLVMGFTFLRHSQLRLRGLPESQTIFLIFLCFTIASFSSYRALAWTGMWHGLKNKPGSTLAGFGLIRVLARPSIVILLSVLALAFYELAGGQIWEKTSEQLWTVYITIVFLLSDWLYVRQAWAAIPAAFQLAATGVVDLPSGGDKSAPKKQAKPAPRHKAPGLIRRLWRRRWIRWTTPPLVLALLLVSYRWNLRRDYRNRLDALRAHGAPVSVADVESEIASHATPDSSQLILQVYQKAPVFSVRRGQAPVLTNTAALFQMFEQAIDHGAFDLGLNIGQPWPYYNGAKHLSLLIYNRVAAAIREDRTSDAIALLTMANRHQELLQGADLNYCRAIAATQIRYLNKGLALLLSRRDPTREQLLELQRQVEDLLEQTPAFMARQVDILNAHQIDEMDQPAQSLINAAILSGTRPPPRSISQNLQFRIRTFLGVLEHERLLRLECAQIARNISLHPSAESIAKIKALQTAAKESTFLRNAVGLLEISAVASLRNTLNLRLAATALAIERYRMDHNGMAPRTVAQLYPLYIKAMPLNPFTNRPIVIEDTGGAYNIHGGTDEPHVYSSGMRIPNEILTITW